MMNIKKIESVVKNQIIYTYLMDNMTRLEELRDHVPKDNKKELEDAIFIIRKITDTMKSTGKKDWDDIKKEVK